MAKSFKTDIRERCVKITTDTKAINEFIHETAMLIINHAKPKELGGHGDCSTSLWLVQAMPASMRRKMLIDWFAKYTPIVVKLGDKPDCGFNQKYKNLPKEEKISHWNIEGADEEPFYVLADKVPEEKEYDLAALINMVKSLAKRIDKKADDGEVKPADIASAKVLARTLEGLKLPTTVTVEPPVAANIPSDNEAAAVAA